MTQRRGDHVEPQQLLAFAEGAPVPIGVEAHLGRCRDCAALAAGMEVMVEDMRSADLASPTEAAVTGVLGLFPRRPPLRERVAETLGRLLRGAEVLPLDSAALVRGEAAAPSRLRFAADDLLVDLEVDPGDAAGEGMRLTGQVFGRPGDALPTTVTAEHESRVLVTVPVGDQGTFSFERLPTGGVDLVLDLGQRHVRLPVVPETA